MQAAIRAGGGEINVSARFAGEDDVCDRFGGARLVPPFILAPLSTR